MCLLGFGSAEESIMRLVSNNIAYELKESIEIPPDYRLTKGRQEHIFGV